MSGAVRVVQEMEERGVPLSAATFSSVIAGFARKESATAV